MPNDVPHRQVEFCRRCHRLGALLAVALVLAGCAGADSSPKRIAAAEARVEREFYGRIAGLHELRDPAARERVAPTAAPALRELADVTARGDADVHFKALAYLSVLGDRPATTELAAAVKSRDADVMVPARRWRIVADWLLAGRDADAQLRVLDDVAAAARDHRDDARLGFWLRDFAAGSLGPAMPEAHERIRAILRNDLRGPLAAQAAGLLEAQDAALAPSWKGKPVVVDGVTHDGRPFSTAQWKGKVVLVDFWATWCAPCRGELPYTKQLYARLHADGFEIVGVSSDNSAEELERFLAANPDMPWPQLFDRNNPGPHPLGDKFEIDGYPTVLLIDRGGVLRYAGTLVSEGMVRKLLSEK